MNEESKKTFNITFTGNFTIEQEKLEQLIRSLQISNSFSVVSTVQGQEDQGKLRLAFTMKETAEILGISYITVHRLKGGNLCRFPPAFLEPNQFQI